MQLNSCRTNSKCKHVSLSILVVAAACSAVNAGEAEVGVVAGWDRLNGRALLGELNCLACHDAGAHAASILSRQAPILTEAGKRLTPQFLRRFLNEPHGKTGTPMPDMLHGQPPAQKAETVESLLHYLVSQGGPIDQEQGGASEFQIDRGRILYHQVGCVACHEPFETAPDRKSDLPAEILELIRGKAKPLPSVAFSDLAMKTTVDALTAFLRDPLHVRPSGRMPSLYLDAGEARAIASYLLRDQLTKNKKGLGAGLDYALYEGNFASVPAFEKLTPKKEGQTKSFDLDALRLPKSLTTFALRFHGIIDIPAEGSYKFWTSSDDGSVLRIGGKVVVNNDGIHAPAEKSASVQLTQGRHAIELGFMQGPGGYELTVHWQPPGGKREPIPAGILLHGAYAMAPKGIESFTVNAEKAANGKRLFVEIGCASCHQTGDKDVQRMQAPAFVTADAAKGCLADKPSPRSPSFAISDKQRAALRHAVAELKKEARPLTVAERIDQTMSAFRCYACHSRGDKGGLDARREAHFGTLTPADLGEEGRLPPHLDIVGAKLTRAGFDGYLTQGKKVRQYMSARMPLFGAKHIGPVPELFAKADAGKIPEQTFEFSARVIDDGRQLVGKKGLACISCHAWGKYQLTGADGLDLQTVTQRLQPGWFAALLRNPQQMRTQTRMPTAWPDGKSFFPDIQGGDMNKQIAAIWVYLSLGNNGVPPDGLIAGEEYVLIPTDEPIVFRTFISGVGAHAIAVGFPQRTHCVFDALRVRTARAWTGMFIDARAAWEGRAGRYANISGDVIEPPAGSPFALLDSRSSPWPVLDMKSKSHPPGWRFLGYSLDDARRPTFRYSLNGIEIHETPSTEYRPAKSVLKRTFHLTSSKPAADLYFRAAVGKIAAEGDGFLVDDRLRLQFDSRDGLTPFIRNAAAGQELLVPIRFSSAGTGQTASFVLEMLW